MNHGSPRSHVVWMLGAAAAVLVGLALSGVDLARALPVAVALACPLGMVAMMVMMGRGAAGHRGHGDREHSVGGGSSLGARHDDDE